jgi:hypothetical protein
VNICLSSLVSSLLVVSRSLSLESSLWGLPWESLRILSLESLESFLWGLSRESLEPFLWGLSRESLEPFLWGLSRESLESFLWGLSEFSPMILFEYAVISL